MLVRKVPRSCDSGKSGNMYDHYVAIDWSVKTMAIGHMSRRDDHPRVFERPTDLKELQEYLGSLKGRTMLTLEESGAAHWLYLELLDYADMILICDPFYNRLLCHGPKTDKIDAGKLCELLRAGLLKEVYHSDNGLYELRTLVSAYQDVVTAGVRALNQQKALTLGHRDKGKSASFIGEILQENIDLYRRSKEQYERRLEDVARRTPLVRFQREIDGIGTIGAVKIVATVVDARRFPCAGKYLSYCGLVKHEKLSGGRSYGRRKPRYSRVLKCVYKTAALAAVRGGNPMREYYDHLVAQGVAEHNARHAVARYIARISYGMLKSGTRYEPYRWRGRTREAI
jgi:Transposase IS116/IS110/IS902 family/Transposase